MILCSLSGIWSANWSDDNRDDNDMLSYFTVIARGSSMSIVVCYTLMTDPVQLAKWQFEPLEISQKVFHGSNFVWILDWISASSVWIILTLGRSLEATVAKSTQICTTIDPVPLFLTCSLTLAFAAPPMP